MFCFASRSVSHGVAILTINETFPPPAWVVKAGIVTLNDNVSAPAFGPAHFFVALQNVSESRVNAIVLQTLSALRMIAAAMPNMYVSN